ncbi:MAG: zeta toxin family protein [Bacteroidales bacterium]|nr:zeta toxin family protein [Bacteroidales bacterium]MBQ9397898.1 zeta toxin family protein [Bacteroidales bacterium]
MSRMYIISGCNGAGKTTASYTILPDLLNLHTFVNADEIADELSPQEPEREMIRASRLMLERMDQLIEKNEDFAVETTLATRALAGTIRRAQNKGYMVGIFYFWLKSDDLAVKRVAIRVSSGGHNVPEATIRRRYYQGMDNLRNIYLPLCNYWVLIDNSARQGKWIAEGGLSTATRIYNKRLYNLIMNIEKQ